MRLRLLVLAAVVGCTAGASESNPPAFTAADSTSIRASGDKWVSTTVARDFDGFGTTVTSDVVLYPPNSKPIIGREAATNYIRNYPVITKFNIAVDEITGRGDVGYDRGTFTLDAKLPNGVAVSDTGSFFSVFRRQPDGTWQHSRVMWVSHLPPAPPAPPMTRPSK
jgi:ketosteroid isomerase-like protein